MSDLMQVSRDAFNPGWPACVSGVAAIEFGGGLVLVDDAGLRLRVYDEGAARLWHALADGIPLDLLLDRIEADSGAEGRRAAAALIDGFTANAPGPVQGGKDDALAASGARPERWRTGLGGLAVEFEAEAALLAWLGPLLPASPIPAGPPAARVTIERLASGKLRLRSEAGEVLTTEDPNLMQGAIYQACLDLIHGRPRWRALIHGAAVGIGGKALGLPATSGSGKSTLAAWLTAQGFTYLSDDLLAVLGDGRVAPWPTALSVKPGSIALLSGLYPELAGAPTRWTKGLEARLVTAPGHASAPLPLHALVFPTYDPGGDGVLRRLPPLEALARLASDRLWIGYPLTPDIVRAFLDWLAAMPAYSLRFADLDGAAAALRGLLAEA